MNCFKKITRLFAIAILLGASQTSLTAQENNLPLTLSIAGVGLISSFAGFWYTAAPTKIYHRYLGISAIVGGAFCIANCDGFADQISKLRPA